jgi:hypothetical protein
LSYNKGREGVGEGWKGLNVECGIVRYLRKEGRGNNEWKGDEEALNIINMSGYG